MDVTTYPTDLGNDGNESVHYYASV